MAQHQKVQLQKPQWVYFAGKIRPWDEAVLHISSEAVTRGLNVFEGLKGYWQQDGVNFGIVAMPRHFARLQRSARLLHIPCPVNYDQFESACHDLIRSLYRAKPGHVGPRYPLRYRGTLGRGDGGGPRADRLPY